MTDFFEAANREVSFGDVFDAAFLHDVFLRADAVSMGAQQLPQKRSGGLAYSAGFGSGDFVLGHGGFHKSILITDNCAVDTALGQDRGDRKPKGRLFFAPVVEVEDAVTETQVYGRFPMPAYGSVLKLSTVELRRCFMVDSRAVADNVDTRIASLSDDAAEALEIRWNAYAGRRGPLAGLRNSEKAASLLAAARGKDVTEDEASFAKLLAELLAAAWRLEGGPVAAAAAAWDEGASDEDSLRQLIHDLLGLGALCGRAAGRLTTLLPAP